MKAKSLNQGRNTMMLPGRQQHSMSHCSTAAWGQQQSKYFVLLTVQYCTHSLDTVEKSRVFRWPIPKGSSIRSLFSHVL